MAISITRPSAPDFHRATTALYLAGMLVVGGLAGLCQSLAQSVPAPKFEVASIRKVERPQSGGLPAGCSRLASNGRLSFCDFVSGYIENSYINYADGHRNTPPITALVEGGPDWVQSDIFLINAKAEDAASREMMLGPMMKALLEDRFKLKVHRVTREVPVYELIVGKNESKLRQHLTGNCTPYVYVGGPLPTTSGPGEKPVCKISIFGRRGQATTVTGEFWPLETAAIALYNSRAVDRPIIDKTGLTNIFDIHLEFTNATPTVGAQSTTDSPVPSIFTAVEELGMKLVPAKGPQEVIVIDHIERPSEN